MVLDQEYASDDYSGNLMVTGNNDFRAQPAYPNTVGTGCTESQLSDHGEKRQPSKELDNSRN